MTSALSPWRRVVRSPAAAHLLLLALAVALAYGSAVPGGFVWLDRVEILEGGYRLAQPGDLRRLATLTLDQYLERRHEAAPSQGGYWRPVYALAVSLDWLLWRTRAWGWHLTNILWHMLVVAGLYALGRRLLKPHPAAR
ncbi:hypothetical protein ACFL09_02190, partial [Planctomycetota bacterium]